MFYEVMMSNGIRHEIDEDDFQKLTGALDNANMVFLKQVAINPSYIVEIKPLEPRYKTEFENEQLPDGSVRSKIISRELKKLRDKWKWQDESVKRLPGA